MSDRGSFVTEYIYCRECEMAVERWLDGMEFSRVAGFPIFAGYLRDIAPGHEVFLFEDAAQYELPPKLCHPVRFALLGEGEEYDRIVKVTPAWWDLAGVNNEREAFDLCSHRA